MGIEMMTMPQLGESVTEGTLSKWLVRPGDTVNKYDPIAEVMTDKVNAEIPSSFSGKIKELMISEEETVSIGVPICTIEVYQNNEVQEEKTNTAITENINTLDSKARYSPAVLRLSQEHNIDLSRVRGTGAGGRITRKDILKTIESGPIPENKITASVSSNDKVKTSSTITLPESPAIEQQRHTNANDKEIPVSAVRKTIAANMIRSKQEVPHAWMMVEADVTKLVAFRNQERTTFRKKEGFNLTYFAFFVKAVAQVLKEYPQLNATWAGNKIIEKSDIHINIAVAVEDSLFVPVIKNADEITIKGIAREISEFADKAKNGKLKAEEMQGGTFTVTITDDKVILEGQDEGERSHHHHHAELSSHLLLLLPDQWPAEDC